MHIFLISLAAVLAFILLLNWLANTKPKNVKIALALTAGLLLLGVTVLLVITGKIAAAVPSFAGAWVAFQRFLQLRGLWKWVKSARQKQEEQEEEPANYGMSREEALNILGLDEGAGKAEVKAAYKKLMLEHHPDQQGNEYFAKKINQARDCLLRK